MTKTYTQSRSNITKCTSQTKKQRKAGRSGDVVESFNQMVAAAETQAILVRDARDVIDKLPDNVREVLSNCVRVKDPTNSSNDDEQYIRWDKLDAEVMEQLVSLESAESQMAAASRLLQLTQETRVDNYSASLAGSTFIRRTFVSFFIFLYI